MPAAQEAPDRPSGTPIFGTSTLTWEMIEAAPTVADAQKLLSEAVFGNSKSIPMREWSNLMPQVNTRWTSAHQSPEQPKNGMDAFIAGAGVGAGILTAEVASRVEKIYKGGSVKVNAELPADSIVNRLRLVLQNDNLDIEEEDGEGGDSRLIIIRKKSNNLSFDREKGKLQLQLLVEYNHKVPDPDYNLQNAYLDQDTKHLRTTTEIRLSGVSQEELKTRGFSFLNEALDVVNEWDGGSNLLSEIMEMASAGIDAIKTAGLPDRILAAIGESVAIVEEARNAEVETNKRENAAYLAQLTLDSKCDRCERNRTGVEGECPGCAGPIPQTVYAEDLAERIEFAGLEIQYAS